MVNVLDLLFASSVARYIAKYVHGSMIIKRCVNFPKVKGHTFASEVVF